MTKDANGRPAIVLGLTNKNWELLSSTVIWVDAAELGLDAAIVIFRGDDVDELKRKMVEMNLADDTILTTPDPTPTQHQWWHRTEGS